MKVVHIHVDCCRNCPHASMFAINNTRLKICTMQDDKPVIAEEIDVGCPLDDETWEEK